MTAAPLRRPLGRLQTALRQALQQPQHHPHQQRRTYANAILREPAKVPPAPATSTPRLLTILNRGRTRRQNPSNTKKFRTGFAVYAPALPGTHRLKPTHPHLAHPPPDPIAAHHAYQIRKMDPSGARTRLFSRDNPQAARPGDIMVVTTKRAAEPFGGVLIGVRRRGIETSILLRGQLTKIGTEMSFKIYSRNVTGIEVVRRAKKRPRRAKLTYLRKPKHDVGDVSHLVREWKRGRNVITTKGGKKQRKTAKKSDF